MLFNWILQFLTKVECDPNQMSQNSSFCFSRFIHVRSTFKMAAHKYMYTLSRSEHKFAILLVCLSIENFDTKNLKAIFCQNPMRDKTILWPPKSTNIIFFVEKLHRFFETDDNFKMCYRVQISTKRGKKQVYSILYILAKSIHDFLWHLYRRGE